MSRPGSSIAQIERSASVRRIARVGRIGRIARVGLIALPALTQLAACSTSGPLFGSTVRSGRAPVATEIVDTGGLSDYLVMFDRLINGDALTRAEAFSDAEDAAAYAPTTANRLRYALALSVPGHPRSDPVAAATRLRDLIAAGENAVPFRRVGFARKQTGRQGPLRFMADAQCFENVHAGNRARKSAWRV
jgi:hypothetical protein